MTSRFQPGERLGEFQKIGIGMEFFKAGLIPRLKPLLFVVGILYSILYISIVGFLPHFLLEALLFDLGLGGGDGGVGVGVGEAAARLAVLGRGGLGGADALAAGADLGAAGGAAVGVRDAAARGELLAVAVADVLGAGVVGGEGEGGDGDCCGGLVLGVCCGVVDD